MKRWSVAVVAAGTPTLYNGHPSTILMPDGGATAKWWTVPVASVARRFRGLSPQLRGTR